MHLLPNAALVECTHYLTHRLQARILFPTPVIMGLLLLLHVHLQVTRVSAGDEAATGFNSDVDALFGALGLLE